MKNTFLLFLACAAFQTAWADQITLKNGDRVTGAIVKQDGKTITIKTDQFGVVSTAWDQVDSIKTDKPLNVVLKDGKTVSGTLASAEGKIAVDGPQKMTVAPAEIVTLRDADTQKAYERLLKPTWGELWTGSANIGLAGSAGNAETLTFTTAVNATRLTNNDKTSIYFNTIDASALVAGKDSSTAQAVRGGLGYDHNVSPKLFVNIFNDDEHDKFQNLNIRFVAGGGFGYHAVKTAKTQLDLLGGFDFNHSAYTTYSQSFGEVFFGDSYVHKVNAVTSFTQSFRLFDDVQNTGAYRVNFDIGATTKLSKWFTWNVAVSDRYVSHPAPGRKTNDLLYTTGLGFTFAK